MDKLGKKKRSRADYANHDKSYIINNIIRSLFIMFIKIKLTRSLSFSMTEWNVKLCGTRSLSFSMTEWNVKLCGGWCTYMKKTHL